MTDDLNRLGCRVDALLSEALQIADQIDDPLLAAKIDDALHYVRGIPERRRIDE